MSYSTYCCALHDYLTLYGVCSNDEKETYDACRQDVCQGHSTQFPTFMLQHDIIICDKCASQDIEFVHRGYICNMRRMVDESAMKELEQIYNPMTKAYK